ncbi:hypothetical protein FOZ62_009511, partial [Perkinsus olseni]
DFANGFLIAEVFARYFPGEVTMHSFDPGLSLATKQNNWETLFKFLKKYRVDIAVEDFEPVIHNRPGAGISIITKVYRILTKRRLGRRGGSGAEELDPTRVVDGGTGMDAPNYAKNTASVVLKDAEIERTVDDNERVVKALIALDAHNQEQLSDRAKEGISDSQYRLYPQGRPEVSLDSGKGKLEPAGQDEDEESSEVRGVEVKALERPSPREVGADATPAEDDLDGPHQQRRHIGLEAMASADRNGSSQESVLERIQAIAMPLVEGHDLGGPTLCQSIDPRKGFMACLFEGAGSSSDNAVAEEVVISVLVAIEERADELAPILINDPVEVCRLWKLLEPGFKSIAVDSPILSRLAELLRSVGASMRAVDPQLTAAAAKDVLLPLLTPIICTPGACYSRRCEYLLYLLFDGFVQSMASEESEMLRALREEVVYCYGGRMVEALPTLVSCMNYIVTSSPNVDHDEPAGKALADVYLYYALGGLSRSSCRTMARGLGILLELAPRNATLMEVVRDATLEKVISSTIKEIESGLNSPVWWEMQVVVVALLLTFLDRTARSHDGVDTATADDTETQHALELLVRVMKSTKSAVVRRVALIGLARSSVLGAYQEALMEPFLQALVSDSPDDKRRYVLSPSRDTDRNDLPDGASPCLRLWWRRQREAAGGVRWPTNPQVTVTAFLTISVCEDGATSVDVLASPILEILDSILSASEDRADSSTAEVWAGLFRRLSGPLFASLLSLRLHDLAALCVGRLLVRGAQEAVSVRELATLIMRRIITPYYHEGANTGDRISEDRLVEFIKNFEPEKAALMAMDEFREKLNAAYIKSPFEKIYG